MKISFNERPIDRIDLAGEQRQPEMEKILSNGKPQRKFFEEMHVNLIPQHAN